MSDLRIIHLRAALSRITAVLTMLAETDMMPTPDQGRLMDELLEKAQHDLELASDHERK